MKTYYLIVINLALALMLISCESESGESPPITFPELRIINEQNQDLLDPDVAGSFEHDKIQAWTIQDGVKVDGIIDISTANVSATDSLFYTLGAHFLYAGTLYKIPTSTIHFYLSLSEADIDTITMMVSVKNGYTELIEVLYNNRGLTRKEWDGYYTVTK
jgi:hypothetical protein